MCITLVLCFLVIGAIYLMGNQAFVAEHKILRMMAYYTARAGIYHALEELRAGNTPVSSITLSHGDPSALVHLQANINTTALDANATICPNCTLINSTVNY